MGRADRVPSRSSVGPGLYGAAMVDPSLVRARLVAQGVCTRPFASPHDVVSAHGAMQGQDLPGVIASIALRLDGGDDPVTRVARVLAAFDDGTVVRGYPMRGTVFAVAAEDLRWMTELCAAGPTRAQVQRRGGLGLDEEQIDQARAVLEEAAGEAPRGLARSELFARWERAGMETARGRGYHVLSYLIATGVAAYGPWNGQDQNVVLAETWLPPGTSIAERFGGDRDAAVGELLLRYLTGHGPATVRDAAWWSKLGLTELRRALRVISSEVEEKPDASGEMRYQRPGLDEETLAAGGATDALHLLPGFDEMVLGYRDRTEIVPEEHHPALAPGNNGVFRRTILHGGTIVGTWKRGGRAGRRALEASPFTALDAAVMTQAEELHAAFPHLGD